MSELDLFQYHFIDNKATKTLVLFHGMGGNESDLFPLVSTLSKEYNFLGLRGNVQESGMNRFFKRVSAGVFDEESIQQETAKLLQFLQTWQVQYSISWSDFSYLGYSNGANMILAMMLRYPQHAYKAVLLHSMLPLTPPLETSLVGSSVLLTYGEADPLVPLAESERLVSLLMDLGAVVEVVKHPGGHELVIDEIKALRLFL